MRADSWTSDMGKRSKWTLPARVKSPKPYIKSIVGKRGKEKREKNGSMRKKKEERWKERRMKEGEKARVGKLKAPELEVSVVSGAITRRSKLRYPRLHITSLLLILLYLFVLIYFSSTSLLPASSSFYSVRHGDLIFLFLFCLPLAFLFVQVFQSRLAEEREPAQVNRSHYRIRLSRLGFYVFNSFDRAPTSHAHRYPWSVCPFLLCACWFSLSISLSPLC